ncbi:MAG: hypothetical protein NC124_02325 [Clostridium sp.]|nr:hypothetical protein [Clostridium sp.]
MLAFSFKYGNNFQKIINAALESGDEIPENLRNVPVINPDYEFYWHCFNDLSSDREMGQGVIGNIPWSSVYMYCQAYDLGMDTTQDVFSIVRQVDNFYCDKINGETTRKMNKAKSGLKTPHGNARL